MKRLKSFFILIFLTGVSLHAQEVNSIINRIVRQVRLFPQEKTYMHTDASDYMPGERIWLKVYVVNALLHESVEESRYVYVELIDPEGIMVNRVKLMNRDGIYAGFVDIPTTAASGKYMLRAYTELMTNLKGYEDMKNVYVLGKTKDKKKSSKSGIFSSLSAQESPVIHYERQGDSIEIRVDRSLRQGGLCLLAHCRGYPFLARKIKGGQTVVLHRDSIPNGVISFLLFDGQWNLLGQRQLFSKNDRERCRLNIQTDKVTYHTNENITLKLYVPDLNEGERADLSVSVTGVITTKGHRPSSILAHLLLSCDVENGIDNPEWYYEHDAAADTLVDKQPWRRYDFGRVTKGELRRPMNAAETSQQLSGKVRTLIFKKPVRNATVTLISPQTGRYAITHTDETGAFTFSEIDSPENTSFVLKAETEKGNGRVTLQIDEQSFPDIPTMTAHDWQDEDTPVYDEMALDSLIRLYDDGIFLQDVEVRGIKRNSASEGDAYAQAADFSFGLHQIEEFGVTCLHELLRRIPGVFVRDNQCYIRANTTIYGANPAVFAVDGIIMDGDYDLDNVQMQDVARIDVFKTGSTLLWGTQGGSGVISVTTKNGVYTTEQVVKTNQKTVTPLGYQKETPFHHQAGMRKTLYWNPNVTDDTLEFFSSEIPGECRVVIEGVTSEGRLIHEERLIKVVGATEK